MNYSPERYVSISIKNGISYEGIIRAANQTDNSLVWKLNVADVVCLTKLVEEIASES